MTLTRDVDEITRRNELAVSDLADESRATRADLRCTDVWLDHQMDHVAKRLLDEFPQVAPDLVHTMLCEALVTTHDARVQQFRSLLAERQVRDRLRIGTVPPLRAR